jgi:hypothetical protein
MSLIENYASIRLIHINLLSNLLTVRKPLDIICSSKSKTYPTNAQHETHNSQLKSLKLLPKHKTIIKKL